MNWRIFTFGNKFIGLFVGGDDALIEEQGFHSIFKKKIYLKFSEIEENQENYEFIRTLQSKNIENNKIYKNSNIFLDFSNKFSYERNIQAFIEIFPTFIKYQNYTNPSHLTSQ